MEAGLTFSAPTGLEISTVVLRLGVALGIGLLLGIERERRKAQRPADASAAAGVRTFTLVTLLGGLAALFSGWVVFGLAGALVAGGALLSYKRTSASDPGLTTEVALMVAFLLGALALSQPVLAAGISTVVTLVLAARSPLHHLVRERLTEREFHDGLLFLGAALVILPLAPDRDLGPGGLINPFTVWRLVVLVMILQAAGYVALRLAGPRRGLALAGFLGGFVSSTATIAAFGSRAKTAGAFSGAVAGAVLSTVATVVFLGAVVASTSLEVLRALTLPLLAAGLAAAAYAAVLLLAAKRRHAGRGEEGGARAAGQAQDASTAGRAFDLRIALGLAVTVALVLAVSRWLHLRYGTRGLDVAIALAGFADAQSPSISAASLAAKGTVTALEGAFAALLAFSTNSVSKLVAAFSTGSRRYALIVSAGLLLVLAAAWLGWWLARST